MIYSPHMPSMMQLLKLTLPSDLKDKVLNACDPTEFAAITPEEDKTCYSAVALAVKQGVMQQLDFTPLTKSRQGKDDSPMVTNDDNCKGQLWFVTKLNCQIFKWLHATFVYE